MRRRMTEGLSLGVIGAMCCSAWLLAAPAPQHAATAADVILGHGSTAIPSHSPIADAAMRGNQAAVKKLLTDGADVNSAQGDGMTALHWAALNGNAAMTKMLLYAGAYTNASTRVGGYTPLLIAARDGHPAVIDALLKAGADPNAADLHGTTPLMLAASSGNVQSVSELLDAGAKVNAKESARGETPLMFATAYGRPDVVKSLLSHGADWKAQTKVINWTKLPADDPRLPKPRRRSNESEKKADGSTDKTKADAKDVKAETAATGEAPAAQQKEASAAPAEEAAATSTKADAETTDAKATDTKDAKAKDAKAKDAKKKEEPRYRDYWKLVRTQGGLTALLLASRQGDAATVQALLDAGADIDQVSAGSHVSPLLIAVINGRFDLAKKLIDQGADVNVAGYNGVTPLYGVLNCEWAPRAEYPQPTAYKQQQTTYLDLMKDLLEHGAKPNARLKTEVWYAGYNFNQTGLDESGATPFWRAAYSADVKAMKLLVAYGADPTIRTRKPKDEHHFRGSDTTDHSGLPPVPVGGPDIPPLLAATGEGYGWSLTSNHHRFAPTGVLAAVKYLVEDLHADVDARDAEGNTALDNAAARGDNATILYLISKGADPKAVNRHGQTVADFANGPVQRVNPFLDTIALLEKMGAHIAHKCVSCG